MGPLLPGGQSRALYIAKSLTLNKQAIKLQKHIKYLWNFPLRPFKGIEKSLIHSIDKSTVSLALLHLISKPWLEAAARS